MTNATQHYVSAPNQRLLTTSSILGVWLNDGEEVSWIWSFDGKYVIGYNIIARTDYKLHPPGMGTIPKATSYQST